MTSREQLVKMNDIIKQEDINLAKRDILFEINKMLDLVADKQALSKYIQQRHEQLSKEFDNLTKQFDEVCKEKTND